MEVAGAVDVHLVGHDIGKVCGMEEAMEIPIINDLTMVLGSISQSKSTGVVIDFTDPSTVYDNVKQDFPTADAVQIANNLSNLGQIYNREDISTDILVSKAKSYITPISNNGTIFPFLCW
ncbi:putative 4-hydroxy-tetrahydrodipicolinate reductase 3 chloroplastic-like isoform X3 [Tripterygium wilfordii]|uniref:Putative 4-hydroxy-tetrahydrodipicolinate reductase 3 chloroplastic-like isoform X3 n=1 Tax=Tripterygium wilfordii TaxID=458696 RepID=A0A7J7DB34_TRIWF|nr:putative 4-hydroxy-tetrahydrodipicolinate reductase 3 chloroplastic-like isoform X3 [Tripterygium wilfordii]